MPDLRELRAFVAVAELLSFTRAAERLHLTQQTVSRTVRDLELELGVELLERTSREVRVTAAGQTLLDAGRGVLTLADAAFAQARAVGTGASGTVSVGFTPAIGPTERAAVIGALRAGTDRSVAVRDLRPGEIARALADRTVDIALASANGVRSDGVDSARLAPTPMQAFVLEDHPLAGAGTATLGDFDAHQLLVASRAGTPYTDLLVARFAAAGATVTPTEARVTGGGQLLTELSSVRMVAAMPAGTVAPPGIAGLDVPGFEMPLVLLWPTGRPPEAVDRLRSALGPEVSGR